MEISYTSWILAFTASVVLGISKSGIKGIAVIIITLMALAFGARASTGLLVPLFVVGDIFAVIYYNKHARWHYIRRFLPWMMTGVVIGVILGNDLPEETFKIWMVVVILASVGMMTWWDLRRSKVVPTHWSFAGFMGILAGITTMIGNLAGAFSNIFFLAMRLPKNEFIGTAAWVFFFINLFKLPFHILVWETITPETLLVNAKLLPGVALGLFLGVRLVKVIREGFYRKMILLLTALGALILLLR
ncbi:sulfite exporter TauE/SafE family protein [Muriicola marianensis]|uniref:Probable membrane transporter protein n=1 Tax=Muriicola marianensis TaxID=1324801 RepID=A0ABQ1QZQ4_9FLAO|nr:sulfite exporter TauE/SafE family protein [Muriicola marianensis]GGD50840.1 anion permease [Muriicola marianensis]